MLLFLPAACLLAQTQTAPPKPTPPKPVDEVRTQIDVGKMLAQTPPGPTVPPDRVVIAEGDIKITAAQFDRLIDTVPEQYRTLARGSGRKQFADSIVSMLVLAQEGQRRKLDATSDYKTLMMFQNLNVLANLASDDIKKNTKVDDADLRKYYDEHKSDYELVHARHILIRSQGSQVPVKPGQKDLTDAEALAKATDLRAKIAAGADFATLAKQESDDTGSGANGGDMPPFRHGQMVPTFEAAAFALKPGELSEPVKSQFGYHIIRVESHESKTFDEARTDIEAKIKPDQTKKAVDDLQKKYPPVFDPEFFGLAK
jgi:peptidyl-prolyl cis-trans isomerase C